MSPLKNRIAWYKTRYKIKLEIKKIKTGEIIERSGKDIFVIELLFYQNLKCRL